MRKFYTSLLFFVFCSGIITNNLQAQTGTWTIVTNDSPSDNFGVMLLLTDGTVICHNAIGGGYGTGWYRLTPDATGSYINGTWTTMANMNYDRWAFSSQVLPSGNVYVAGGEYGPGGTHGEVYSPYTNTWTNCNSLPPGGYNIYDGNSELLYDGTVLEGPQIPSDDNILIYNPSTNNYTIGPSSLYGHDEASWLKLPDSSVLYVGIGSRYSNRYIPQTGRWVDDGIVPGNLYDSYGDETGPAFMLPNGKAIFFGSVGYNSIYTPSGDTNPGTWATADSFPKIGGVRTGMPDAAAAMMVNGKILCAVSPIPTSSNEWHTPIYFVEYDYTTNTFAQVTSIFPEQGSDSIKGNSSFQVTMLDLPDGNVLVSVNQASFSFHYFIYTPGSPPIPQGKPTINNVYQTSCYGYTITGKLFNGISEGAAFGDDWQMSTNYPIVRLVNGSNVYYAQTSNWNRIGAVQTDSLEDTAQFTLPAALPVGTYSLVLTANGFASNPVILTTTYTRLVVSVSTTHNESCIGGNNGSVEAIASGDIPPYTYLWSNGATTSTVSGLTAGSYEVTVTGKNGCVSTSDSTIITGPNPLTVSATQLQQALCNGGSSGSASGSASGGTLPYTYTWSNSMTGATVSGLSAGTYSVTATDSCGNTATASVSISQPTPVSISIESQVNQLCYGGTGSATSYPASGGTYGIINTIAGNGMLGNLGDGGAATAAELAYPSGLAVDASGNIFIADEFNMEIREVNYATGIITTVAGNLTAGYNGDGRAATSAELNYPTGVAVDAAGNIFIADQNNSRIREVNYSTGIITTVAGNGTAGYSSDGIQATSSELYYPQSVAVDASDNIYIADNYNNRIREVNHSTGIISTIAGNGTPAYNGDGILATAAEVNGPTGIIVDAFGNILISDYANQRIRKIDHSSGYISTVAGNGGFGYNGDGILADSAELAYPLNMGVDALGNIFIANDDDNTVRKVDYSTNLISTTAGNRVQGYSGDGGPATNAEMIQPWDVKVNPLGNIVIADNGNYRIREVSSYTYVWAPYGGTTLTATGLSAGVYTITATDENGCTGTASVNITQPSPMSILHDSIAQTGPCNGMAGVSVSGGASPYTYVWSPGGQTNDTIKNQCAGSYCCTVTDNNDCSQSTCVTVVLTTAIGLDIIGDNITIYPEPNNGNFMISGVLQGQLIDLYDCLGRRIKHFTADRSQMQMDISSLANGIYFISVKNSDGSIVAQKKIVKTE